MSLPQLEKKKALKEKNKRGSAEIGPLSRIPLKLFSFFQNSNCDP